MFEKRVQDYLHKQAPATVIPGFMPISAARAKYGNVYKLTSNENPFGVSPKAQQAIQAAIPSGYLYSDGSREKVLIAKLAERNGVQPENIFISSGAANVLNDLARILIKPGDECIISRPSYPPYYFWTFQNGGVIVDIPCKKETQTMDMDAILSSVTDRTKLLFLCNPNNPTSTAIPRDTLVDLLRKLPSDVFVIADEAYIDFADDPDKTTLVPYIAEFPNLIVVRTFSKIYGMASVRLGYAVAYKEIITYLTKSIGARDLNCFAVEGGIAALDDEEFRQMTIQNNKDERRYLTEAISRLGFKVYDSQTNFIWVSFGQPAPAVHDALLPRGVLIRGDLDAEFNRISIGLHVENEALIKALEGMLQEK